MFFFLQEFRQIIRIQMGTKCVPLIVDLVLYCYQSQFMAKSQNTILDT